MSPHGAPDIYIYIYVYYVCVTLCIISLRVCVMWRIVTQRDAMRWDVMWWYVIHHCFSSLFFRKAHTHISYIGVDEFIFHYFGATFSTLFAYCRLFCVEWIYDLLWRVLNQNPTTHFNIVSAFLFFKKTLQYIVSAVVSHLNMFSEIFFI